MAVTTQNPAPYAPTSAILEILNRYRNRGLTKPLNAEVLSRAGVSDSLVPRTLQALQSLELVDEQFNPTETMEALRRSPEPELKKTMAAWISHVYSDVLSFVNASDDETAIRDAFRHYNPVGQQTRMVSLFMGLCRAAGMRSDEQAASSPRPNARKPQPAPGPGRTKQPKTEKNPPPAAAAFQSLPAPLAGLLATLPVGSGIWTRAARDKFETAFNAMLDYCFTISETAQPQEDDSND